MMLQDNTLVTAILKSNRGFKSGSFKFRKARNRRLSQAKVQTTVRYDHAAAEQ